jgi:transposase
MNALNSTANQRIIGLDMHPDIFSAAAIEGQTPLRARTCWIHDARPTANLEPWAKKNLLPTDIVVLEASGNSFNVASRLHAIGFTAIVLESAQAAAIKENYCNDDRSSAVRLGRSYLTGLHKEVWQPDAQTRQYREIFFAHRNAVKDSTRLTNRLKMFLNGHGLRLNSKHSLSTDATRDKVLAMHEWTPLERDLLLEDFATLRAASLKRARLEKTMTRELSLHPNWSQLWRLMGIRHKVAFGLMAFIGDIHRFPTPKKLCGYFGLAPGCDKSGNDKDIKLGIGRNGRGDVRALLIQSAQNALNQKGSPLHKWGWNLLIKKNRNLAVAAVARKLTVSVWHLLEGHYSVLEESNKHLLEKLQKLSSVLGKEGILELGFKNRAGFVEHVIRSIQTLGLTASPPKPEPAPALYADGVISEIR